MSNNLKGIDIKMICILILGGLNVYCNIKYSNIKQKNNQLRTDFYNVSNLYSDLNDYVDNQINFDVVNKLQINKTGADSILSNGPKIIIAFNSSTCVPCLFSLKMDLNTYLDSSFWDSFIFLGDFENIESMEEYTKGFDSKFAMKLHKDIFDHSFDIDNDFVVFLFKEDYSKHLLNYNSTKSTEFLNICRIVLKTDFMFR